MYTARVGKYKWLKQASHGLLSMQE
jgi:hypothetical protein